MTKTRNQNSPSSFFPLGELAQGENEAELEKNLKTALRRLTLYKRKSAAERARTNQVLGLEAPNLVQLRFVSEIFAPPYSFFTIKETEFGLIASISPDLEAPLPRYHSYLAAPEREEILLINPSGEIISCGFRSSRKWNPHWTRNPEP